MTMTESSEQMGVFDVIYNCRAMRRLDTREVPEELLRKLVDAGNQAPTGSNQQGVRWIIVGDSNYGEGSSREHAAMTPRYLGCMAVIARSFARIHETNLKKQGILALTFSDPSDYDIIQEDDIIDIVELNSLAAGRPVSCILHHSDGTTHEISLSHSYSESQLEWFRAGSTLNII